MSDNDKEEVSAEEREKLEYDMDSIYILPLSIIPFKTKILSTFNMVKSINLQSSIEMFSGEGTGVGLIHVVDVPHILFMSEEDKKHDMPILFGLSKLSSYDVYSLRIVLRREGIALADNVDLSLSEGKKEELKPYMAKFTQSLISQIYGGGKDVESVSDPVELFRNPDVDDAKEKLQQMADSLGINIMDVPDFLENCGDIFLALSYYRSCLDELKAPMNSLLESLDLFKNNLQLRQDNSLMRDVDYVKRTLSKIFDSVTKLLKNFDSDTGTIWDNLDAKKFERIRKNIEKHHETAGLALCVLSVKLLGWQAKFPNPDIGGVIKRSEFLRGELKVGLERINLENLDMKVL